MYIIIHYDFSTGEETSFIEIKELLSRAHRDFKIHTHCFDFFTPEHKVMVIKKDGSTLTIDKLLRNDGVYTDKKLKLSHNFPKLLRTGAFKF